MAPAAARAPLRAGTLHAYLGADPFAGGRLPPNVRAVESLGSLVTVTGNAASPAARSRDARCELLGRALRGLQPAPPFVAHPYPVTPYHPDFLEHWDLAQARREEMGEGKHATGSTRGRRARGA